VVVADEIKDLLVKGNELFDQKNFRRGPGPLPGILTKYPEAYPIFRNVGNCYFAQEKAIRFGDRMVMNTHFPPYPSRAFDNLAEGFRLFGGAEQRRLYSVTWAVTNRCPFDCWHCYNAGRSQEDLDLRTLARVAGELREMGAVMVTLTDPTARPAAALRGLQQQYRRLKQELLQVGLVALGTITPRTITKRDPQDQRRKKTYGPYYQWTYKVRGKTVTVNLTKDQAIEFRKAIQNQRSSNHNDQCRARDDPNRSRV
jgi:hypothetical protein